MKQLARKFIYWEGISRDIDNFGRACKQCQILGAHKTPKVYGNWPRASKVYERVHIDFFQKII